MRRIFVIVNITAWVMMLLLSFKWPNMIWFSLLLIPISLIGLYYMYQTKHALMRNLTFVGCGRCIWNSSDLFFASTYLSLKPMFAYCKKIVSQTCLVNR